MTTIRKQSIISSGVVYVGLALGALTQYLLAKVFNPDQYGLINGMFVAIGMVLCFVASLGMPGFIFKFYPYYKDNLPAEKNDMMGLALTVSLGGFLLTLALGIIFSDKVLHFYQSRSAALIRYYYWIFPFGLGMMVFGVLEAYAWQIKQSILTSYLREVQIRVTTLLLIVLYITGVLGGFDSFVKLYSFNYLLIAMILAGYLVRTGQMPLTLKVSRVTRKFLPKIRALALLSWGGGVFFNLSFYFAQIVIAGVVVGGLTAVGIFTFAQFLSSLVQAPQRAVAAASVGPLARAWKDKDLGRISRIYHRSAINQLIFSLGLFLLISINYQDGIHVFRLNPTYLAGQSAFLFIGLARVVDLGTGVNSQVIVTSVRWRFELFSGVILVVLTIPLNYFLAKRMGLVGPAIADLITFFIYNGIRWLFLFVKYRLQPFDRKSGLTILLGVAALLVCRWLFGQHQGLVWMITRSVVFLLIYAGGVLALRLSEDVLPVWQTVKKRLGFVKGG
jgi:O-antigen/teichoic acid export membrane protein